MPRPPIGRTCSPGRPAAEGGDSAAGIATPAIAWPFYGFLIIFPLETLRILFGDQWDAAAELIPVFCSAGAVAITWLLILPMIMSTGRADIALKGELIMQPLKILILTIVAIIFKDAYYFSLAFLATFIIFLPITFYLKESVIPTNWLQLLNGLKSSLILTSITLSMPALIKILLHYQVLILNQYATIALSAILSVVLWVLSLRILNHPLLHDPVFPDKFRQIILTQRKS